MKLKRNKVCICVPIYKEKFNEDEWQSVTRLFDILGHFDIFGFCPKSLNLSYYNKNFKFKDYCRFYDDYFTNQFTYSKLLLNSGFYKNFVDDYEYMLIYQPDAWVFKDELIYWVEKGYDYIGAPYVYQDYEYAKEIRTTGNGGFSLRKIEWMIENCDKFKEIIEHTNNDKYAEDFFIRDYFDGNYPSFYERAQFSFEILPHIMFQVIDKKQPFGCHAYKTVMDKEFYDVVGWIKYKEMVEL